MQLAHGRIKGQGGALEKPTSVPELERACGVQQWGVHTFCHLPCSQLTVDVAVDEVGGGSCIHTGCWSAV